MKAEKIIKNIGNDLASLIKVMLMSKGTGTGIPNAEGREIAILGNGPSLRKTIDEDSGLLETMDLMAVNFAANTPDFLKLRPRFYILADGVFFKNATSDANVQNLWRNLSAVSWRMTLFVPTRFHHLTKALMIDSTNVKLATFNLTPVEGNRFLSHLLFDAGLGMPRPRNVMVPALMCAISMGYKKIFIYGADHTWTKTLDVTEDNTVISVQPHFYEDNENERVRVRETYKDIRLHEVLGSMATAFKSYCEIAEYAKRKGVEIINATPNSMIDAFPRK